MKKLPTRRGDLRWWIVAAGLLLLRPDPAMTAIGTMLIGAGAWLHVWAKGSLQQERALTTWGPYAWVRHPFYLSNFMVDAGIVLLSGRWWLGALAAPFWAFSYGRTIRREERELSARYGESFRRYRAQVPAWMPWRRRSDPAGHGGFSWNNANLSQGREWARALRLLAYPLIFATMAQLRQGRPEGAAAAAAGALLLHGAALWIARRRRAGNLPIVPRPTTHDSRLTTHDPRLTTHDPSQV
jgi:hypothetical protein